MSTLLNIRIAAAGFAAVLAIAATSGAAKAAIVTWDFKDVVFKDGGTVSGSFKYDSVNEIYTAWNITTTATTDASVDGFFPLNGATYTTNGFGQAGVSSYMNPTGTTFTVHNGGFTTDSLAVIYVSALTDAGGTIALKSVSEFENRGFVSRGGISSGSISSVSPVSAVPLPAALPLLGSALLGLGGLGYRRRSKGKTAAV